MDNIYEQKYQAELTDLQDQLINLQNNLISMYNIRDDVWRYHPNNENFVNPIVEYDNVVGEIEELQKTISKIELKVMHLKSANQ
tara:strand:+ start:256 stop:507 length:252 start_codon:yes stop_codon:yes gene_type:complete